MSRFDAYRQAGMVPAPQPPRGGGQTSRAQAFAAWPHVKKQTAARTNLPNGLAREQEAEARENLRRQAEEKAAKERAAQARAELLNSQAYNWEEALKRYGPKSQSNLGNIYGEYLETLGSERAAAERNYDAQMAALRKQFNWEGEDPTARAIRDYVLADLTNQTTSAGTAINTSYDTGIGAVRGYAQQALQTGRDLGAEMGGIYNGAAEAMKRDAESLGAIYGDSLDALGGGGVAQGTGALVQQNARGDAATTNALALALGQIASESQNQYAASMEGQKAAQQGQLQRESSAMRSGVNVKYAQQEAARRQRELEMFNSAGMNLTNQYNGTVADFGKMLASGSLEGALAQDERDYGYAEGVRGLYSDLMVEKFLNGGAGGSGTVNPEEIQKQLDYLYTFDGDPGDPIIDYDEFNNPIKDTNIDPALVAGTYQGVLQKTEMEAGGDPAKYEALFAANLSSMMPPNYLLYLQQFGHLPTNPREVSNYRFGA